MGRPSKSAPALSALASIRARRGDYGVALDYIEKAVEAGELAVAVPDAAEGAEGADGADCGRGVRLR